MSHLIRVINTSQRRGLDRRRLHLLVLILLCLAASAAAQSWPNGIHQMKWTEKKQHLNDLYGPDDAVRRQIAEAMPARPAVPPKKPRRLLVYYRCPGYVHQAVAVGNHAIVELGRATGAFKATLTDDPEDLLAENLAGYDGLLINNNASYEKSLTDEMRRDLLDFVRSGKGFIGIHAASDSCKDWPEGAALIGGIFSGHPWGCGNTCAVQVESPDHPVNAAFAGQGFWINDEIYDHRGGPDRASFRILLSLDMGEPQNRLVSWAKREKLNGRTDFPVSWLQTYGEGRVFYCSLGHQRSTYWNRQVLRHYLDGIRYALGDLEADATPSAKLDGASTAYCSPLNGQPEGDAWRAASAPAWPSQDAWKKAEGYDAKKVQIFEHARPSAEARRRISESVRRVQAAEPKAARKVMLFYRTRNLDPVLPTAVYALEELGRATGAFELKASDDPADLETLSDYDALVLLNNHSLPRELNDAQRRAVIAYVEGGKGVAGFGAVADGLSSWKEGVAMLGASVARRPFHGDGTWPYTFAAPGHPLLSGLDGEGFRMQGSAAVYQPVSKDALQVLVSLDVDRVHRDLMLHPQNVRQAPVGRDYPVAWIHPYGDGRVFYTGIGSDEAAFWSPVTLQHYLNGIQYALGDR